MTTAPSGRLQNTPPAYLPGNACPAAAADGVSQAGFVEGVRNGFLDGDFQGAGLAVKLLDHAGQLITWMILLPQIGDSSIAHVAL